ncbi:MAG TPA: DEAD/DEAH box helicase [Pirellulales bacterium]|jgi:ATP-dependent RNA helicase RhlE|nr:DEAD/DEAH box helicase [Pirellulales bacterium]
MTFSELELIEPLQRALATEKYLQPTPIQAQAIPHLLAGKDLLGCAQTGTGKTAAFALPILQRLDQNRRPAASRAPRVLVLSPTRELAAQIGDSFRVYGRHLHLKHAVIFGGVGQNPQVQALNRGVHILVATPGRLLDLMGQGFIRLDKLEVFVLDEADRMFDMGFLPDLKRIIAALPAQRQSLFFSATMPSKIAELANSLLTDPVQVTITPAATTVDLIEQRVMFVPQGDKRALLNTIVEGPNVDRCLVFTRTKHGADKVAKQLSQNGHAADAIHGNKSQSARERALQQFRSGKIRVLVATDVAARGIDVDGVSHVINFDMPHEPESYVHRIGRTGRAGASGIALSFCDASERRLLRDIERLVRRQITVDSSHEFHSAGAAQSPRDAGNSERPSPVRRHGFNPQRYGQKFGKRTTSGASGSSAATTEGNGARMGNATEGRRPKPRKPFSAFGKSASKGRTRRRKTRQAV